MKIGKVENIGTVIKQIQSMGNLFKAFKDTEDLVVLLSSQADIARDLELGIEARKQTIAELDTAIENENLRLDTVRSSVKQGIIEAETAASDRVVAVEQEAQAKIDATQKALTEVLDKMAEDLKATKKHYEQKAAEVADAMKELHEKQIATERTLAARKSALTAIETQIQEAESRLEENQKRLDMFVASLKK